MNDKTAYRGSLFYFKDTATISNVPVNKDKQSAEDCQYVYIEDGLLIIESGKIVEAGTYSDLKNKIKDIKLVNYAGKLITPGFIDTHQHASQSAIVAAYGEKLLEWLENYVFPAESTYIDDEHARNDLNFFLDQLLKNGTTTAVSYGPLFYSASDIFFEELTSRNMRFITGNILMDINSPDSLKLTAEQNYDNCKQLIERWHNTNRLSYCISPRFALSCSQQMLELCGALKKENPDCYIQTHLDENLREIAEVKKLYPKSKHYMDVYDHFGLVTDRTVFGHCIHTTHEELELFKKSGAIISWCPLSNNFLGSGLFNFGRAVKYTDKITMGTDWGAGNCLSMFAVLDDAYKVSMLNSVQLPSMTRWYMATYGAAKALQLDDKIGNFSAGKEADFVVIDADATPYLKYRREKVNDIFEFLFILMTLGSEENIKATYIYGKPAYINDH
ncbi:guanine deaminase [Legionella quateirensis]|uniref:Guanine deaminase n=1 Tax=Legionella quateirensis TaxID=45072 RepID=A0A378KX91_9GAMM|nr:guanine deaminase [Legionella quateirensis]KTD43248.1 guanine aminohydrolase [Legionella quateirensis]STY18127.1 guanine deaminase [Legionella quateirensis]